jgi:hypothetical protein
VILLRIRSREDLRPCGEALDQNAAADEIVLRHRGISWRADGWELFVAFRILYINGYLHGNAAEHTVEFPFGSLLLV